MGLLKFLKWTFSKDARYVPRLTLSDGQDEEGPHLCFGCEGDHYSVCYAILERLCAEKYVAAWVSSVFRCDESRKKQERNHFLSCFQKGLFFRAELVFADAAERADPILGNFFPGRAGGYAVIGITDCGVIDIAADITDIFHGNIAPYSEKVYRTMTP